MIKIHKFNCIILTDVGLDVIHDDYELINTDTVCKQLKCQSIKLKF